VDGHDREGWVGPPRVAGYIVARHSVADPPRNIMLTDRQSHIDRPAVRTAGIDLFEPEPSE
jgi:hypothetical protein